MKLKSAIENVEKRYKGRIGGNGADQVDIVDKNGNIVSINDKSKNMFADLAEHDMAKESKHIFLKI